jgi:hypothetical protein
MVRFVTDEALQKALLMEQKLASLSPKAGIIFVSVQPQPVEGGDSEEFFVRLGLARHLTERTGKALVQQVLAEEMKSGLKIFAGVYRGVSGTCRDDGTSSSHPASA